MLFKPFRIVAKPGILFRKRKKRRVKFFSHQRMSRRQVSSSILPLIQKQPNKIHPLLPALSLFARLAKDKEKNVCYQGSYSFSCCLIGKNVLSRTLKGLCALKKQNLRGILSDKSQNPTGAKCKTLSRPALHIPVM